MCAEEGVIRAHTPRAVRWWLLQSGLWLLFFFELSSLRFHDTFWLLLVLTGLRLFFVATALNRRWPSPWTRMALGALGLTSIWRLTIVSRSFSVLPSTFAIDALLQPVMTSLTLSGSWGALLAVVNLCFILLAAHEHPALRPTAEVFSAAIVGSTLLGIVMRRVWLAYEEAVSKQLRAAQSITQLLQSERDTFAGHQGQLAYAQLRHSLRTPLAAIRHTLQAQHHRIPTDVLRTLDPPLTLCLELISRQKSDSTDQWFSLEDTLHAALAIVQGVHPDFTACLNCDGWRVRGSVAAALSLLVTALDNCARYGRHTSVTAKCGRTLRLHIRNDLLPAIPPHTHPDHGHGLRYIRDTMRHDFGGTCLVNKDERSFSLSLRWPSARIHDCSQP